MNTTVKMKMARADAADMEVTYELAGLVDAISRGDHPATDDDAEVPDWFDEDDIDHLKALHKRLKKIAENSGAIWRVIGGYSTLSNPSNQLIDLTKDVIELHPRIAAALAAQEAMTGVAVASYAIEIGAPYCQITIERTSQMDGSYLWKAKRGSDVLNKDGDWEYEPLPSSRDDAFLARCRFANAAEAIAAAQTASAAA
ncbi:hypothetical protein [Paraburkholderia bannensis]|uniref:hypothetical protein n=1 Tax=Paraburkholderia bannensis TaxID=765414 RepID=UPI00048042A6|nr:hypothetical protein [Paraburkholderia bannensis]